MTPERLLDRGGDAAARRIQRRLLVAWLAIAFVVWNGVYDMRVHDTVRGYLMETALAQAHLGGGVDLRAYLHRGISDAIAFSTAWACGVLLAGLVTIRVLARRRLER